MAQIPKEMKPLGYTTTFQQGDWLVTFEVVGYNDRAKCNIWAEKKRKYNPRPQLSQAIAAIDAEVEDRYIRDLHKRINSKV